MIDEKRRLPRDIIIWGATGQALLIKDAAEYYGTRIVAVFTDTPDAASPFPGIPIYRGWKRFYQWADGRDLSSVGVFTALNMTGAFASRTMTGSCRWGCRLPR